MTDNDLRHAAREFINAYNAQMKNDSWDARVLAQRAQEARDALEKVLAREDLAPARAAILARGRASAVVLQKALGIGYGRAVAILDALTARGDLGPDIATNSPASGSREIRFA